MTLDTIDWDALERECELEFFTAGGPGGQHRNRVATGVRLRHLPSGTVVTATERRSQAANRRVALQRLAQRLAAAAEVPLPRVPTRPSRAQRVRRLDHKRRQASRKAARRRPASED